MKAKMESMRSVSPMYWVTKYRLKKTKEKQEKATNLHVTKNKPPQLRNKAFPFTYKNLKQLNYK